MVAVLLWHAIAGESYALADDARQHVVWMLRFTDAELFANDLIADYYQSVSPIGFAGLYRLLAIVGVSPLVFCQLLPPLLIVLTGAIAFLTVLELSALPAAGFVVSALMTQSAEYTVTVASGTSKAFVYGLMLLFMYGWLRRSRWLSWGAILLQGLFYPQTVLLSAGLLALGLVERRQGRWGWRRDRALWILTVGGLLIAAAVILYYGLATSEFGPTVKETQALTMPEFFRGGRTKFFKSDWVNMLLYGRSGLRLDTATTPVTNLLAIALPLMLRWPRRFALARSVSADVDILLKLVVTGLFWFMAAHAVLFKLYLPSRYTGRFLLIAGVLGTSLALVLLLDALLHWAIALLSSAHSSTGLAACPIAMATLLSLVVLLYPLTMPGYPYASMTQGSAPELYQFIASQPKASLVAGLTVETANIPSYAQRSVLISREVAIPYHVGYYAEIRQRAKDLIAAQYSSDPAVVKAFIQKYGVTHWLLESSEFDIQTLNRDRWLQQYQPEAGQAVTALATGKIPALQSLGDLCVAFQSTQHVVVEANCILNKL